jgi:serine/threonine-protein kinase
MPNSPDPDVRPSLRLTTLGGLSLVDAAGVPVGQQRRRLALLVLLARAGEHGLTRDRLFALLSPESTASSARHALHQLLYYLRRQAGNALFLGTDPLRLNPVVVSCDATDLEGAIAQGDLTRAIALYRGPFLDGFHLNIAEFDEWAAAERSRLATLHAGPFSSSRRTPTPPASTQRPSTGGAVWRRSTR